MDSSLGSDMTKIKVYWNSKDIYQREEHGIIRYKHNMTSITHKFEQVNNIPTDAFPCVITFRNEIISDIIDNFTDLSVYEHKPYADGGIIALNDASVTGERGAWAVIVTTDNGK
jgi:hypothetical protein